MSESLKEAEKRLRELVADKLEVLYTKLDTFKESQDRNTKRLDEIERRQNEDDKLKSNVQGLWKGSSWVLGGIIGFIMFIVYTVLSTLIQIYLKTL